MACLVRVPTENVKQKLQAGIHTSTVECVRAVAKNGIGGFYQGCTRPRPRPLVRTRGSPPRISQRTR